MDTRPVVGVVGHEYVVRKHFGDLPVTGTPRWYADALAAVGARPVLLPGGGAPDLLDVLDALVLTGGGDVDPVLSGGDPATASEVDRERDDHEIALVRAAARAGVPLLGVCRGLQVLAVAFGGTLVGGLDHARPHDGHEVATAPDSVVRDLVGPRARTSALHRQAVADPGSAWRPTAWAGDGVVEAIEWIGGDWAALGVQWHPELAWHADLEDATGPAIFGWLADAARARSMSGGGSGPRTLVRS
jgi:putative glutamine amidotransferase